MIRHRPAGTGNPYEATDDQRVPVRPLAGRPFEIRATSPAAVDSLRVELSKGPPLAMRRAGQPSRGRQRWTAQLVAPRAGDWLRYRIAAGDGSGTRWWRVAPAEWSPGGGWRATSDGAATTLYCSPDGESAAPYASLGDAPLRLIPASLEWLHAADGIHGVRFELRLAADERLIGFGERYDRLDQRGKRLDVRVFEPYKRQWQGSRTYLPMPFWISSGGWGGWLQTSRRAHFDLGSAAPDRLSIEVELDGAAVGMGLVLVEGSPQQVLSAFLEAHGGITLPPDWIFGPWMSGNEWNSQTRILAEVARARELGIPAGVVVIEAWSDEASFSIFRDAQYAEHPDGRPHRLADFRFPQSGAWPNPKGMVDALHAAGMRVLLWQVPLMKRRRDLSGQAVHDWQRMLRDGYAVRRADGKAYRNRGWWFPDGLLIDFTHDAAREWWLSKRRYLVEEVGIDGFKTDGGEHAWGDDLRYADGRTGAEVNNEYPVLYQAAYHELLRDYGRDGMTFSRSGFVGSARYPAFWAGDEDSTWEAFRAAIVAGQLAGSSGIFFWGWDIGGFSGDVPTAELYLRSTAMAAFCPIMQFHSEYNAHRLPSRDRTPWNIAERSGDRAVIDVYRRFARMRDRLLPYLSAEARHAVANALPLMRPLAFDDPADGDAWAHPLQYRLGRALVVAPVTEPGAVKWPLYAPHGEWTELWSGRTLAGPASIEVAAPLDEIPILVKRSAARELRRHLGFE